MVQIYVPGYDNSPSIEQILRPISYMSWLMGVGVARPRKCSKFVTIIIRILHLVFCSSFLLYILHKTYISDIYRNQFSTEIYLVYIINHTIYFVSAYCNIYHGIRQYNKWPELMDKIKKFDRKIKRETYTNDYLVEAIELIAIFMTFVYFLLYMCVIIYFFTGYSIVQKLMICLHYYIIARSLINSFVFDIVVYVLYRRHQTINKLIDHLDELSNAPLIALKIRCIRELHNDICDLVTMVNDMHSIYLLLCSANCFFTLTVSLFHICKFDDNLNTFNIYAFDIYMNLITYNIQIGLICWICTLVRQEFNKTKIIICTIALKCKLHNWNCVMKNSILLHQFLDQNRVRNEINDFFIQLQNRHVSFTACGFFEMNNNLLCNFIGIIVTYCAIVLQFSR
ncbi:uncharacterized protein LOC118646962 isoform X2 [Monomorium pharaonis]|uniref:uncharacterized protein LOC118646962 isoform X2 n=1 Tax=Monomorium pharaonis TaxID=307658 RepID=UPI001747247E|nr:uncharacterized protein LOC118646962 isoform X2 [Monomorium pharaonis]